MPGIHSLWQKKCHRLTRTFWHWKRLRKKLNFISYMHVNQSHQYVVEKSIDWAFLIFWRACLPPWTDSGLLKKLPFTRFLGRKDEFWTFSPSIEKYSIPKRAPPSPLLRISYLSILSPVPPSGRRWVYAVLMQIGRVHLETGSPSDETSTFGGFSMSRLALLALSSDWIFTKTQLSP